MDKKIAVLGDIHANLDALDVVLADAKEQGATDWICVGDVVGYNACPNECCAKIRELGAVTVCGNHDHYCAFDESLEDFHPLAAAVVAWTRRQLSTENREWLRSLPYQKVVRGLTVVHATLDQPEHWGYVFESVEAEPSFTYQRTQLCFHGHTHVPAVFEQHGFGAVGRLPAEDFQLVLGRKYFVNTGSVGQPRDSDSRASYILYEPGSRTIRFRRLDYDVSAAQQRVLAAGLPEHLARRLAAGR
ncbi:MAG: metallophosphoesterase family protein [Kiritimatiellae bacterium]|nr:metallophosphoesterase family protein [Kiritimatiellia bacterium]